MSWADRYFNRCYNTILYHRSQRIEADIPFDGQYYEACLLHLHTFNIQFASTDYFYLLFFTIWTVKIKSFGGKNSIAVAAAYLGWSMHKEETGLCRDGVFAKEAEIEIHSLFKYTRKLANNEVNPENPAGFGFLCVFDGQG